MIQINTKNIGIIIAILLLLGAGYMFMSSKQSADTASPSQDTNMETATDDSMVTEDSSDMDEMDMEQHMAEMDDGQTLMAMGGQVSPAILYVSPGQELTLANHESFDVALESEDGTSVATDVATAGESITFLAPEEVGTYTYTIVGYPDITGTIVVEE